jgi:hypothetical protein
LTSKLLSNQHMTSQERQQINHILEGVHRQHFKLVDS